MGVGMVAVLVVEFRGADWVVNRMCCCNVCDLRKTIVYSDALSVTMLVNTGCLMLQSSVVVDTVIQIQIDPHISPLAPVPPVWGAYKGHP